ncbi:hypothetical protein GR160_16110 [Flavobacterium sp. Sd200]|uniref:hypothetical protein n=1 Tax=Flavobacterium sp. Sd200 TaxID=2692211 RepID=UPI00136EC29B|nr:hypothetical protein [Flavobacterium sp. Sd200]MXN92754.1 hypothetical protein [Flavobacterium sp. Sd200]
MKHVLIAYILLLFTAANAQNTPKITKSSVFKDKYNESYIVHVKEDGTGGLYMLRMFKKGVLSAGSGYYLEHYDKNMNLIKDAEYAPEYNTHEKYKTLVGVFAVGNSLHLIDVQYNIKEKAYICNVHSADINTMQFTHKELLRFNREEADKLGTLKLSDLFYNSASVLDDSATVAFITDDNNSAFAIAFNLKSDKAKILKLYSFDSSLTKKIEHTYKREVKSKDYRFKNIDVANGGSSIYLLGAAHREEDKRKTFIYEITHIGIDNHETTGNFTSPNPFSETLKMFMLNDKLVCAGFYSEPESKWYNGVSYFEIDPKTLSMSNAVHTPFSEKMLADKNKKRWWEAKLYKPLLFKNIIVTPNNDIIINAEEYYSANVNNQETYNYDDIITARITSTGEALWITDIRKSQYTFTPSDVSFLSYTPVFKNDIAYYFINTSENVKTTDEGAVEFKQSGKNKSDLTVVTIDAKGDMKYEKLLDNESNAVPFMTARGAVTSDGIYFLGRKGGDKQLLKIGL